MVNQEEIKKLMVCFPNSFINSEFEFIADRHSNLYFILHNCLTELDVKCKVLEWFSRDCFKTQVYRSKTRNEQYHNEILECVNQYLGTQFTQEDMEIIYNKLGNSICHNLTVAFVESGYNMQLLEGKQ